MNNCFQTEKTNIERPVNLRSWCSVLFYTYTFCVRKYIYIYMELCTIIHLEVGFLIAKYFILEMCVFICISNCSLYVIFSVDTTVTYYTMWLLSDRKIGLHVFISQLNLIKRKIMHKLNFRHHAQGVKHKKFICEQI